MRKFGTIEVLAAAQGRIPESTIGSKTGHRAVFQYVPKPGFLYVRSRAISSRCNDNFDMFPADEIKKAYKTFIGKPVFVNHVNDDHRQMRGLIIDAALHEDVNPDGSPDTWTEVLMEVDGKTYPKLAAAILAGDIDRTSMGCDVQISKCSVCGNEATSPLEYCSHIPGKKGQRIYRTGSDGRREGQLVFEICSGLSFFENSLLVEPPADPTAYFLGKVEVGPGLEHIVAQVRRKEERVTAALIESKQAHLIPSASLHRTASSSGSEFLNKYPSDEEIDRMREGGFGGGEPWHPYKHELASRPEPRVARPVHIALDSSSREHGSTYKRVPHDTPGSFPEPSPEDQYHGPYEVIRHPDTGRYHVVDNQDRVTRYGGGGPRGKGMEDRFQAEHARDYAEHRQAAKEHGRALADSIFNKSMEILDPGGTPESRESDRRSEGMNRLLNLGYHPKDIQAEREDHEPYAEIHHPSGFFARDHGGDTVEIGHRATGDEMHDMFNVRADDNSASPWSSNRRPGYGPVEVAQELHHWVTGDPEETGGGREHLEQNDPRIRRWKQRHGTTSSLQEITLSDIAYRLQANRVRLALLQDTANVLRAEAAGPKYKDPGDHPWFQENPISADHIVRAWKEAKPTEKRQGKSWYADAHLVAKAIAHGDAHKGAGVLAAYSPQTAWPHNMHNAARALETGEAIGGKGSGVMATEYTKKSAQRIIDGEHHEDVLRGPKIRAFAHLIEHGGDADPSDPKVVVDRHALSVARGKRVTDAEYASSPLNNEHYYGHVENAYHEAARRISAMSKEPVHAHQVQAVTWMVQQRRNAAADAATVERLAKGRTTNGRRYKEQWEAYAKERFPQLVGPGYHTAVRKSAYGETKAPQDVDTLRDERCAICGNDTAFDGRECQVCGYLAPPKALGDPDVDKAKNLDALKQSIQEDLDGADPSRLGAEFDPGDPNAIDATGDNPNSAWLECDTCGSTIRPAPPMTEDDKPGMEQAGPAEGDPCPECQDGQLISTGISENDTDEEEVPAESSGSDDSDSDEDEEELEEDEDEDEDTPASSTKKLPASKNSATAKYRHPLKERQMQNALAALAELQSLVEYQQHENRKLQQRVAVKDSQIQRLAAGLQAIAQHLGPEVDTIVRTAMIRKRADEQNPAQPVPEPAAEPPAESTIEAKTPEAFADVRAPGMVPGSNQDVAADAVTTAYTPGQDIPSPAVKNLVDVTRPVDGTQGPRPLSETKTNVDVRVGNPMNPQTAFPLNGPFSEAQRTASSGDLRFMAAMRLARLQIQAQLESGDDLSLAQRIASSNADIAEINHEIELLNKVSKAAARRQAPVTPPRNAVPRPAVQRTVPALSGESLQATASLSGTDDDLSLLFLGDALSS